MVLRVLFGLFFSLFFLIGGLGATASAQSTAEIRLITWKPTPYHATFVLPATQDQTDKEAAEAFAKAVMNHPDLRDLNRMNDVDLKNIIAVPLKAPRLKSVLLLANDAKDFKASPNRIFRFMKPLSDADADAFVLPVGAAFRLSADQREAFYQKLGFQFPMVIAMGGDDVDPSMYGQENLYAQKLNTTRDILEAEFLRYYIRNFVQIDIGLKGFVLGVCRGHQLISTIMGAKLVQDIPKQIGGREKHSDGEHEIRMFYTKNNLLKNVAGLDIDKDLYLKVNSLHHQAVNPATLVHSSELQIAATTEDGIIEAIEFKSGGGLLMQFHPEYMKDPVGSKILQNSWKHAKKRTTCRSALKKPAA